MEGVQNLKDKKFKSGDPIRILMFGPAGGGKTTIAATFPKPFFFNFDNKLKSLYGKDVDYKDYSYDSPTLAAKNYKTFWKDFRDFKKDTNYKTGVFDSLTTLDAMILCHCNILAGNAPDAKPDIGVYREQSDLYTHILMEMNALKDKNVILIAHPLTNREKAAIGEEGAIREVIPLITGKKITAKLPAMFEEIYYVTRDSRGEQDKITLQYKPMRQIIASSTILRGKEGKIVSSDLSYNTIIQHATKEVI